MICFYPEDPVISRRNQLHLLSMQPMNLLEHSHSIRYKSKIIGLYLGKFPAVAVYDFDMAKELFAKEEVTGRPDNFAYRFRTLGQRQGLMFNEGSSWKSHRRFTLKSLRDFGFGKASLDSVLIDEADRMGEFFIQQKEEPFLVQTLFNLVILNVLWTIVAGKRCHFESYKTITKI